MLKIVQVPRYIIRSSIPSDGYCREFSVAAPSMEEAIQHFRQSFPKHSINNVAQGTLLEYYEIALAW